MSNLCAKKAADIISFLPQRILRKRQNVRTFLGFTAATLLFASSIAPAAIAPAPTDKSGDITFFVISDTHYGLSPRGDEEIPKLVEKMNQLPGTEYPMAIGGGKVGKPLGVLHIGDETNGGTQNEWEMFVRDYGLTGKEGKLAYPVYETVGNHDSNLVRNGIRERNKKRVGVKDISGKGLHYSWDWNNIHFVSLGVSPGTTKHPYDPEHSIEFLEKDLEKNSGKSGRPVILMHHFGFDREHSMRWWNDDERTNYYNVIINYNIIGIIHGHTHKPQIYQWQGINIYNPPHFRQERPRENGPVRHGFFVFRISADELSVAERRLDDTWGMTAQKKIKLSAAK